MQNNPVSCLSLPGDYLLCKRPKFEIFILFLRFAKLLFCISKLNWAHDTCRRKSTFFK